MNNFFLVVISIVALLSASCIHEKEAAKPNIILVFVDDLGYADLGCYGQKLIQTPNLDKMAAEGQMFTDFYSGAPVCAPSRCCLMTGKHAGNAYVRHNINQLPLGQIPIPTEEVTIAEILKDQGYSTGAFGKWAMGSLFNEGDPLEQGFDHFYGYYCQCKAHNYYPEMVWRNKDTIELQNETVPVHVSFIDYPLSYATKKVQYSADLVFDEAIDFIEKSSDKPFFVYYATTLPHSNGEAPKDERFEIPDWGIYADSSWLPHEKGYAAMVTKLDDQMGKIVSKLKELEIEDNTLVLFTSDNGPTKFAKIFNSAGEFRGRKRDLYEGGLRMPLITWGPGIIKGEQIITQPAAMYDMLPTFAQLTGDFSEINTDGRSLMPLLKGEKCEEPEFLYWEFYEGERAPKQAVRIGDWKAIRFHFYDIENTEIELYNLADDAGETTNLADQNPEIVQQMVAVMEKEHSVYPNINKDVK